MHPLGPPPAWLAAVLLVVFGLVVSAPCALAAVYLYSRLMARRAQLK